MCLDTKKVIKSRHVEFLEHKSANKKWEICPSGCSGVFVDTSLISNYKKEDEEENFQSENDDEDEMEEETKHVNTSNFINYKKYNHKVKNIKYQQMSETKSYIKDTRHQAKN